MLLSACICYINHCYEWLNKSILSRVSIGLNALYIFIKPQRLDIKLVSEIAGSHCVFFFPYKKMRKQGF